MSGASSDANKASSIARVLWVRRDVPPQVRARCYVPLGSVPAPPLVVPPPQSVPRSQSAWFQLSPFKGEWNMGDVAPAEAEPPTEQVNQVADAISDPGVRSSMLATLAAVSGRLTVALNGAVSMRTETDDGFLPLWSAVRVVSNTAVFEEAAKLGWGLPKALVDTAELFCAFGTGEGVGCLVNFVLPRRSGYSGQRRSRGTPAMPTGTSHAQGGAHVAFKDENGDVLRGTVLTMSLYMPASKGGSKATICGEQVVVFAFVFVAVRMTWQLVVRLADQTLFHTLPTYSFRFRWNRRCTSPRTSRWRAFRRLSWWIRRTLRAWPPPTPISSPQKTTSPWTTPTGSSLECPVSATVPRSG